MLEDGGVVSPGGGGQVDDFVAGEPLGQEVGANPKDCSKRDQNKCIFVITLARFFSRFPMILPSAYGALAASWNTVSKQENTQSRILLIGFDSMTCM